MVKGLVLMRHAEREDRAQEQKGIDWISTAIRPQDPVLSEDGIQQARNAGAQMKDMGITKILVSPLIRTVMTADLVAEQIGLGENSICIEMGLVEEAKSFRGKTAEEPKPNWNPLILPKHELAAYSSRLNLDYESLMDVQHVKDDSVVNTIREVHESLVDRDEVTKDRCRQALQKFLHCENLKDDIVLCVGHGATVKAFTMALEHGLPEEEKIKGERTVSCFALFKPIDPNNPLGQWRTCMAEWGTGDLQHDAVEVPEDMGLSGKAR